MLSCERVFLVGYMGCGKTTIGRKIASAMGYQFIDLDWYLEQRFHQTISAQFALLKESGFREREKAILHEVSAFENCIISTGGGAPCYGDNMQYMNLHGITVYLNTPIDALYKRLYNVRGARPLLQGKNDEELLSFITSSLAAREPYYKQAIINYDNRLQATKISMDLCIHDIVNEIMKHSE